jgi:hypothetical protein
MVRTVGIRGRIASGAGALGSTALHAAATRAQRIEAGYRGLRSVFEEERTSATFEALLAGLVAAVRADEHEEDRSARDVLKIAASRRRRLGLLSFGAGPLAGVAGHVVDLYCETATFCDVAELHTIELTDQQVAGHMLVLWQLLDDLGEAQAVVAGTGTRSLRFIVGERVGAGLKERLPEEPTRRAAVKALWDARSLAGEVRKGSVIGNVAGTVLTGPQTKRLIRKAEAQLGVG